MAKATFKCAECGASVAVVGRNRADADRLAEYREQQRSLCHDCWTKQRDAERAEASQKAADEAAVEGMPVLQGSEKQVAWAERIRADRLENLSVIKASVERNLKVTDDPPLYALAAEVIFAAIDAIKDQDSSHWWIENRDAALFSNTRDFMFWLIGGREYARLLPEEVIQRAWQHFGGLKKPGNTESATAEVIADAKAEATIRPESPKTEAVAELLIAGKELHISFPEKREDFRLLMRETLGMKWKEGYWGRLIDSTSGTPDDRMIEAGHRLLAAGFIVRIYDAAARSKAVAGEFEPEHTRWVVSLNTGKCRGWFGIRWSKDEDYYAPARKLPRSQYEKPCVAVPSEQFEELLDFADRYDFHLSIGAKLLAEQAKANRDAALVAKVEEKPKAKGKRIEQANKPAAMTAPESEDLDDDLRDA